DRAIADYAKAIELDPKNAGPYNARCWLRAIHDRDLPLALADCDAGARLAPDNANILYSRGFVQLRLGRLDEAIADYDAALRINPRQADALYGRGLAKRKKGDQASGDADIAAATAIQVDIAADYARYGMGP
ncbi:MAG TPA: tetratricopeptide repeat protein, partial [Roseiarcus sp.]|nr:tetratricopeptide repeat protein [Roseiarcus sp.]